MDMKANLPAIILATSIVIAAVIYACSTRYVVAVEHDDRGFSYEYAFDRWTGGLSKIYPH
jgi:hypothetical protein